MSQLYQWAAPDAPGGAGEGRLCPVERGRSRVGFCVRYFPLQEFHGEFTGLVGGLALPSDTGQVRRSHFDMHSYHFMVSETVRLWLDVSLVPRDR